MKKIYKNIKYQLKRILNLSKSNLVLKRYLNKNSEKRVLLVSHQLTTTGSPLMLYYLAENLKKEGYNPLLLSYKGGSLRKKYEKINVPIVTGDCFQTDSISFRNIAKHFDKIIVNTVVCYSAVEQYNDAIWWIHEGKNISGFIEMFPQLEPTLRKAKNIYVVSDYAYDVVEKYNKNVKITLLGVKDFLDKTEIQNENIEKIKFAIVGDICDCKGQDILSEAILKLDKNYLNQSEFYFFCNKKGRRYRKIKESLENLSNIHFCDWFVNQEKKFEEFSKLDVFVIPSRDESCSLVALESCMLQKPIIISDNVGAKYMIQDDKNGYVVKTEDSVALKEAIEKIINKKNSLSEMGKISRKMYEEKANYQIFKDSLQKLISDCQ